MRGRIRRFRRVYPFAVVGGASGSACGGGADAIAETRRVSAEILEEGPRFAEVTQRETRLVEPAQAGPQAQAVEAGDYARDIAAVFGRK